MCDVCWVSDDSQWFTDFVMCMWRCGYERCTTIQNVLYIESKTRQVQRRAAAGTTACKQIEHFLSSKYNNFTASELLDLSEVFSLVVTD